MSLTPDPSTDSSAANLFFVNLGGYDPREFGEIHRNVLVVANDIEAATKKALGTIRSWTLPHKDNVFEVEKAIDVSQLMNDYGYHLRLTEAVEEKPFAFTCAFIRTGI